MGIEANDSKMPIDAHVFRVTALPVGVPEELADRAAVGPRFPDKRPVPAPFIGFSSAKHLALVRDVGTAHRNANVASYRGDLDLKM
jgi:S1-C subfamily serine protease